MILSPRAFWRKAKGAFTLVELLVSMAVLSLMLIAVASATTYVANLFVTNVGAFDNFSKARTMLSVFDRDIQMMVMRRDLAAFVDNNGKPACAFYTNVQGYPGSGARAISLVSYQLTPASTTSSALNRLNYGMNYTAGSTTASVGTTGTLSQLGTLTLQTDSLATGVIAFQWQFIDGNGNVQTPTTSANAFIYNYTAPGAATNYRAVVVSMVVLSNSAYNLAIQSGTLATVEGDFPSTTSNLTTTLPTYSQYWNSVLNGSFDRSVPQAVRAGIEVIVRYIPLPITTPSS